MRRRRTFWGLVIALVALTGLAGGVFVWLKAAPRRTPAGQPGLARFGTQSYSALRDAFNASIGQTRILVLFSPT